MGYLQGAFKKCRQCLPSKLKWTVYQTFFNGDRNISSYYRPSDSICQLDFMSPRLNKLPSIEGKVIRKFDGWNQALQIQLPNKQMVVWKDSYSQYGAPYTTLTILSNSKIKDFLLSLLQFDVAFSCLL